MADATLTPVQTAQKMFDLALAKNNQRADIVFFKAVLHRRAFLSFGGLLHVIVSGGSAGITSSNPGLVKVLGGLVFPVGLVMIVLQGQELLTSNMMTVPMLLVKRAAPWWSLPMNWLIVLFGNLTGSLFFAGVLVKGTYGQSSLSIRMGTGLIQTNNSFRHSFCGAVPNLRPHFVLHKAMDPHWHQIFLRGIGCNWLVCIAVWQAMAATEVISKIVAIFIPIFTFVAAGFDHVVANMFFIPLGIMMGADMTVADYIKKSLIASFLGNVVGALLVALPFMYFFNPLFERESRDLGNRAARPGRHLWIV
ncbi:formate/nitrite transporter family protein [Rhizoctonia solani]|uniref:Formate/nitrite transporter family protein n=1 Tax=Rhizoctonia solani TaxID=456999 RepID=A0A8H8SS55_9AGAM|nr:formate/nitrite transporter family protein [Rhizoctonia solani]QRW16451.1 formate/nitrite transporter family protein [Rhizoctonia solani]